MQHQQQQQQQQQQYDFRLNESCHLCVMDHHHHLFPDFFLATTTQQNYIAFLYPTKKHNSKQFLRENI